VQPLGRVTPVAIRKLDGTPPVSLGQGTAGGLSPDGRWAISILPGTPARVTLLPTGAGQARTVPANGLEAIQSPARFLPDGRQIIVNGNEANHSLRCYVLNVDGGKTRAVTPEGIPCQIVSPDGGYVLGASNTAQAAIYPINGGAPHPVPGLEPDFCAGSVVERWFGAVWLPYGTRSPPLSTGSILQPDMKIRVQELLTAAPAGVVNVAPLVMNREASQFVYSYYQVSSVLYMISDLR